VRRQVPRVRLRPSSCARAAPHFAAEPEKWLRVTALLCAASIAHYEDPEGTLEELLNCFVDD
jgi:hypothetical protein